MVGQFPSTTPLYLGQVSIGMDHDEFLDAIGYGLMSYFESSDLEQRQMSAQALLEDFKETLTDDGSLSWRIGFILGQFAGLLNPDLKDDDPCFTYLESLSQKCERCYGGSAKERHTASVDDSASCSSVFA